MLSGPPYLFAVSTRVLHVPADRFCPSIGSSTRGFTNDSAPSVVHMTVYPESDEVKRHLQDETLQADFPSADVFPTEVDWLDHPLGFACEARVLAALTCGQVRI